MKIKGPFGEIEVVNGELVKGISPCKSCEHQYTCQFEERCGARFEAYERKSDQPKIAPGAVAPKTLPKKTIPTPHNLEVIGKSDRAIIKLDGKQVCCRSLTFNCGMGECPTVTMELLVNEYHIDYANCEIGEGSS